MRLFDSVRRRGALSWELRTSTSSARLQQDQGRTAEAGSLLEWVRNRFSEGFETTDSKAAKAHLNSLQRRAQVLAVLIFSARSILTALLTY